MLIRMLSCAERALPPAPERHSQAHTVCDPHMKVGSFVQSLWQDLEWVCSASEGTQYSVLKLQGAARNYRVWELLQSFGTACWKGKIHGTCIGKGPDSQRVARLRIRDCSCTMNMCECPKETGIRHAPREQSYASGTTVQLPGAGTSNAVQARTSSYLLVPMARAVSRTLLRLRLQQCSLEPEK